MADEHGTADVVLSAVYTALMVGDLLIVVDICSGGALHRWAARQVRALHRSVIGPLEHEAEIRRASAWVVWEAMQVLEQETQR